MHSLKRRVERLEVAAGNDDTLLVVLSIHGRDDEKELIAYKSNSQEWRRGADESLDDLTARISADITQITVLRPVYS